jgi:hypothetical protein
MAALQPDGFFVESYASADFADAEETRPITTSETTLISLSEPSGKITNAVENLIRKHTLEIQGRSDIFLSATGVNYPNQLRRKLRDFFMKEQQTIFQYLEKPVTSVPMLSSYNIIMKKFGRPDFNPSATSLRDLAVDLSGDTVLPELNARLGFDLAEFTERFGSYMNTLKEVLDEISTSEDDLKTRVAAIDKLTQNVQSILTLSSTNPIFENMIKTTEQYIGEAVRQNSLEDSYKNLINCYKKLTLLKESFLGSRVIGSAFGTEPLCSVCINESVSFCFSPCGHTFCQACTRKQHTQCFICRQVIRERVKLFFS